MIDHLGGLERFVKGWQEHIKCASQKQPGSLRVLQAYRAIIRLTECVHQMKAANEANELVESEDIERLLEQRILDAIQRDPSLAVDAARDLGWTVIPPQAAQSPK